MIAKFKRFGESASNICEISKIGECVHIKNTANAVETVPVCHKFPDSPGD